MGGSDLKRRLARLEGFRPSAIHVVPQFVGMTEAEALRLRYGEQGPPPGARLLIVANAPETPPGVPYDWAEHRDDPLYAQHWEACRQSLHPPFKASA